MEIVVAKIGESKFTRTIIPEPMCLVDPLGPYIFQTEHNGLVITVSISSPELIRLYEKHMEEYNKLTGSSGI